jgi:hypothetical protein
MALRVDGEDIDRQGLDPAAAFGREGLLPDV